MILTGRDRVHEGGISISFKARNINDQFFWTLRNKKSLVRFLNVVLSFFFSFVKDLKKIFIYIWSFLSVCNNNDWKRLSPYKDVSLSWGITS